MTPELTIGDYLLILRRRAWLVGVVALGAVAAALLWSALQTPMYRSSARILINQSTANDIFDPVTGVPVSYADRVATNEVQLLQSQLVRDEAEGRLGFRASITARAESRADVVVVTAENASAELARHIAQTYADSYLDVRRNEFVAERLDTAEKLLGRIAELDAEIALLGPEGDTTRRTELRDDLADSYDRLVITADLGNNGSARIIDDATRPADPFVPRTNQNVGVGAVLGLLVGIGGALLLESLDRSIKSRQLIEELTPGLPSLAVIPNLKTEASVLTLENPDGVDSEVFRTLRAGLEFASVDRTLQVIQVTSPGPSAGKTTVAANLAVAIAQAGQRVAVIDADLRRPRLHEAFEIEQVPGLTSVILGRENLRDSSKSLRLNNGALWVFPSGPVPPGPSELLGSERARKTFELLRKTVDVIIVDSAPVLPVADAVVLSRHVDATLLVANARTTKRDDLVRAVDQLEQAGAEIVGTVLNQVSDRSLTPQGYGYGYGSPEPRPKLFSRRVHAPRLTGTATLPSSELPRFNVAKPAAAATKGEVGQLGKVKPKPNIFALETGWLSTPEPGADAAEARGESDGPAATNGLAPLDVWSADEDDKPVPTGGLAVSGDEPSTDESGELWGDNFELRV